MVYIQYVDSLKKQKLAGITYEKSGHTRFRDCISIYRNGKVKFDRFCYGEAAGLVFSIWGTVTDDGVISWTLSSASASAEKDLPHSITSFDSNKIFFDEKPIMWDNKKYLKSASEAGISKLSMIFSK